MNTGWRLGCALGALLGCAVARWLAWGWPWLLLAVPVSAFAWATLGALLWDDARAARA